MPYSLHKPMANSIRMLAMDAVEQAQSGHPGMPMGMADVATVLWRQFLRFDPKAPAFLDRDRFILSAGHGSMLLYALAYLTGYDKISLAEIKRFRQLGSHTPGHPERDVESGIEMTTGPLGQGFATSVGFALAERLLNARFGDDLVDHRTFVIASDGDLMEGISHEAASLAGHLKLGRLIVFYDDNKISIDGTTDLSFTEDVLMRFRAYGWHTQAIDGHDPEAIAAATQAALDEASLPSLIACRTIIGYGAPKKQGTSGCHGSPLGREEVAAARCALGLESEPFDIPAALLDAWRETGARHRHARQAWEKRLEESAHKDAFTNAMQGTLGARFQDVLAQLKERIATDKPLDATRQSSGKVLGALMPLLDSLVGGSADLSPSNNTQVKGYEAVQAQNFKGRYIHYGVREHGMAALMNGMALHGGIIPYGGTFMQFVDYCRPAVRLAALMRVRSIFVMTHDSIGLGEDGPTHQPVEHLASLRVIPNLLVFRPCDGIETAESWELALRAENSPSILSLSRQALPTIRNFSKKNLTAKGAYILKETQGPRDVTLLATGSEVAIAIQTQGLLLSQGIKAAVVSMPCFALFDAQDEAYKESVLGAAPRVAIEAGMRMGWDLYLGCDGRFVGLGDFGASAPAGVLYEHFGLTAQAVEEAAKSAIAARKKRKS